MTFDNRMKAAKVLIEKGVTEDKDPRVKEYKTHQKKLKDLANAKSAERNALKRGKK